MLMASMSHRLETGGPPAGLFLNHGYDQEVADLSAGDRVVFVTDGISERLAEGLDRAVAGLDREVTAAMLCTSLFQLSEGPVPLEGWDDDRTAVVLAVD